MIRFDDTAKRLSKKLKISKELVKKVLNKTFDEIENNLKRDKNFMFKGYVKFVKSKQKKKPITKNELFNLKTKDK
jgi:nucleoid DNA-binding protein|tara:strand:- start:657 stop:881 length:225 start_codon:yes stop_codon:yes gene_type:complete